MRKPKLDQKRALTWRILVTIALLGVALYVLLSYWRTVSGSLEAARHVQGSWLVLSLLLMALTFCIASAIYGLLALHPLRYRQTLLVEVAGAFVGRLLPAGLGGLGLNGVYLYRRKHTPAEATAVISVNNLIGMCAHLLLLAGVLVAQPQVVKTILRSHHLHVPWSAVGIVLLVLALLSAVPAVRSRLAQFGRNLLTSFRREGPGKTLPALLLAALLTVTYTLLLLSAARSVGIDLSLLQLFIVFSFGMLVGTATPTPGGLVGAEAGLFAGFVAYGVSDTAAGAAVVIFRLVSYWLPLIPGVFALLEARRRQLL